MNVSAQPLMRGVDRGIDVRRPFKALMRTFPGSRGRRRAGISQTLRILKEGPRIHDTVEFLPETVSVVVVVVVVAAVAPVVGCVASALAAAIRAVDDAVASVVAVNPVAAVAFVVASD